LPATFAPAGEPDAVKRTHVAAHPAGAGRRRPRQPPRGDSRSSQGTVVSPGRGRYSG